MTVVKFSVLTLLAGGFCTLLGIGMWMGPQDTPCSAQTGTTAAVAVADSPPPCKSCWSAPSDAANSDIFIVATEVKRGEGDCDSGACTSSAYPTTPSKGDACESGACDLVATSAPAEPIAWQSAPVPTLVPRIPAATFGACSPYGVSESGVCVTPGVPCPTGAYCPPGGPCPPPSYAPAPTYYGPAPVYHVAPCAAQECPPPAYSLPYGAVPANVYPAPVVSTYAAYREVEPRTSDQPSMEMIEAFMEEREKRYEAQIEALEAVTELKLEAQAAVLKAEHEVAMAKLHAEAYVKLAGMEQALREEKALLQLVADGTLPTESLRAILAKNQANGHGSPVRAVSTTVAGCACEKCACESCKCGQAETSCACAECKCEGCACPGCEQAVSTAAGCACEKCACESCKCGQPGASCVCAECKCEGCACPGCEQAVSTAAPACVPCEASACKTSACGTKVCGAKACETSACKASACGKSGDCTSCEACTKECVACTLAPKSLERIGVEFDFEGERCTILSDGITMAILGDGCTMTAQDLACIGATQGPEGDCTIVFGQKAADCAKGECKTVEFRMGKKALAVETADSPFVCEKDGCVLNVRITEVPVLSDIPYIGRIFRNVAVGVTEERHEAAAPAEEAQLID